MELILTKSETTEQALSNLVFVNKDEVISDYIKIKNFVYKTEKNDNIPKGKIALNSTQRENVFLPLDSKIKIEPFEISNFLKIFTSFKVSVHLVREKIRFLVKEDKLEEYLKTVYGHIPFTYNQNFLIKFEEHFLKLQFLSFGNDKNQYFYFKDSSFDFIDGNFIRILKESSQLKFLKDINFISLGIGGLEKEFQDIFRRAFSSRLVPLELRRKLKIKHVKGLLLYGPSGTGKTLIARKISSLLQKDNNKIKLVNGPEIFNKYIGESEKNVRDLFEDAEKDEQEYQDHSPLHVIIFDEFDSICKTRGTTSGGTNANDNIVNQLLSKIDGVNQLNNILLIGLTNRKDIIDPAILRPGRFEVQIEIGLPDKKGREQILNIHTNSLKNYLKEDIDILYLAEKTRNYTGAELEGLVNSAMSRSFVKYSTIKNKEFDSENYQVTKDDFENALKEIVPVFGNKNKNFSFYYKHGIIEFNKKVKENKEILFQKIESVKKCENFVYKICIEGKQCSGKTAFSSFIADNSNFPYVEIITSDTFLSQNEHDKVFTIDNIFKKAYNSELSFIVFDDIERIIEYSPCGPRFSNFILQTLIIYFNKYPPKGNLIILCTTSCKNELIDIGMTNFDKYISLPEVETDEEYEKILNHFEYKQCNDKQFFSIKNIINELLTS